MSHILTLITENIFVIIGFALYGALVYYMFTRVLNRHFGKKRPKSNAKDTASRKNFSKHVVGQSKFAGNDFSNLSS